MFKSLDPLLHSELRLAIMSILVSDEKAEFTYLKEKTNATAGNLSVQLQKLSDAGYLTIQKTFKGKYPLTRAMVTQTGMKAFESYVESLKSYFNIK